MTLPRILGVTGYAQAGKDTLASILKDYGYQRVAFADQLKDLALRIDPYIDNSVRLSKFVTKEGDYWEGAKQFFEVRRFLQKLGNEIREVVDEDAWIRALAQVTSTYNPNTRLVISDVRYINEGQWVRRLGGEVWRITRYAGENKEPYYAIDPTDPSEREVPAMYADLDVINDDTLESLDAKVRKYLDERGEGVVA